MSDPLDYMNILTMWKDPPEQDDRWIQKLAQACDMISNRDAEIEGLKIGFKRANEKWRLYEEKYILPCFKWAEEEGIDLKKLVKENPGHNCVELLFKTLKTIIHEYNKTAPGIVKDKVYEIAENIISKSQIIKEREIEIMENKFKIGDLVQLKSGGPIMTVTSSPQKEEKFHYCSWFNSTGEESNFFDVKFITFPEDALKSVEDEKTPK